MDIKNIPLEKKLFFITHNTDCGIFPQVYYGIEAVKREIESQMKDCCFINEEIEQQIQELAYDMDNNKTFILELENGGGGDCLLVNHLDGCDYVAMRNAMLGKNPEQA